MHEEKQFVIKNLWSSKNSSGHAECNFHKSAEKIAKVPNLEILGSKSKDNFKADFVFGKKISQKFPVDIHNRAFTSILTFRQNSSFFLLKVRKQI